MDSLHGIKWIMFHGHFDYFVKPPLGSRPNTKPGDHGTLNAHNRWFNLFYHMWGPTWIKIHWNSILVKGPVTYDFTVHLRVRDHTTWFWRCVGTSVFLVCLVNATFLMWWVCHKKVVQLYHYYSQNLRQLGKLLHYQAIKDSPNTSPSTKKFQWIHCWTQWSEIFLGITGWDSSVCKSNRLHVDILQFFFIELGDILYIPLKWLVIFLQSWTSTGYFSNSTGSFATYCRFSPIIGWTC